MRRGIIMKLKNRFTEMVKKYKHAWVLLYIFIYMPWFMYLEKHVTTHYHVIQVELDEQIPFIEYFIIPYLLWFVFIIAAFLYFFYTDVPGFYKMAKFMFTGMTVFLIISTVFPNGQDLRPVVFERDNIFVDMVRTLYRADTCTNVFPSLHVFNSLSVCVAISESNALKKRRGVCVGAYVLAGLIILATMFLKQHSVLDVLGAGVMACVLYQFVYAPHKRREPKYAGQKRPVV
ncbi:phosphatase PAP2 family protein [Mediterraneibacter glycyrrhizinilyticus]|nr:phosphatase PAP2 family protein [Mediterraneibacter glycyrrhizinilyticus]HJA20742.1 phosphatase PAP2 family protein [Candidatus Mediterraneibacter ornithocaccae]